MNPVVNTEKNRQIEFLKVFSTRIFKSIAAQYLKTNLADPFIKNLQRELIRETNATIELLQGISPEKLKKKAGGETLKRKNPEKFRENFHKIQNDILKRFALTKGRLELYIEEIEEEIELGITGTSAEIDLLEDLFPQIFLRLREEYLKKNAYRLWEQGKLLTIKQTLNVLKFIKNGEDFIPSLKMVAEKKLVRKIKGNKRQTIYKWIKDGKLRAIKVTLNNKKQWVIEQRALQEFSIKQSWEDARRQLQKRSQGFCFRYTFLTETEVLTDNVFCELRVPYDKLYIMKLPVWEMLDLIKKYPHGLSMEKELQERFSDLSPPFAVEIGYDDTKNLEWIEKEKIVEVVVRGAIGRKWISFDSESDWIQELQIYVCQEVIPFLSLHLINTVEDLKKYLRIAAHHKLARQLRESKDNRFLEFEDWDLEAVDDFEE